MSNANDFIASVYNNLATAFNMDNAPANLFMQMAWPGIPISAADFKNEAGQYDANLAEEVFSSLANIVPILSKSKFELSGINMDDIYEIIISSARPNGVADADVAANPLYKLFSDAQYEFVSSIKGSSRDPNEMYHRCVATPSNWYDQAATAFWPSINITSGQVKPAEANSPFVKYNGNRLFEKGLIKVKDPLMMKQPLNTVLLQKNMVGKNLLTEKLKVAKFNVMPQPLKKTTDVVLNKMKVMPATRASFILNNSFKKDLAVANLQNMVKRPLPVDNFTANTKLIGEVGSDNINLDNLIVKPKKFLPRQSLFLNNLLIENLPTQPSQGTDGFNISFKFCRVNIDRPWMNLALLSTRNWNIYGAKSGEYSNGMADNNPGLFPLIPTSFIMVSDVSITANWSQTDKNTLAGAVSFGPFDIRNGSFNQNKLEIKGMQIIGCLSKLTPLLAPADSPVS